IVQLYADYAAESLPSSLSYNYSGISNASGTVSPDFIPESWVLDLFDGNDMRASWFEGYNLTFQSIKGGAYILNKFPGNPALNAPGAKDSNWINKIKPFRIAEQYLIAAEAYAMNGNDEKALEYYNALRAARIADYEEEYITGEALVEAIKEERVRELIGEGFRFYDLKRYGKGMTRSQGQNDNILANANDTQTELFSATADNFRWLWPIPQAEIDSNPQIKGQQNSGY
ncbi:MAG: RagB/SusD family nutrient uptake outer membrane protein, partial [Bacteroidales bacterium]|nr:RagB/SusD family nutrient uptake outer membrane protein [Bacteroidales bacterium]